MRIDSGGSGNINVLQSDVGQFRNKDFITDQGKAFFGGNVITPASAKYATVQLHNPSGSGIVGLVDRVILSAGAATGFQAAMYNTAIGSNNAPWANRRNGGNLGKIDSRASNENTILGANWQYFNNYVDGFYILDYDEPLELFENDGAIWLCNVVNIEMVVAYFGREI